LFAAEQIKPDCCHTPAVVSILLNPLPVSCPSTTPLHYKSKIVRGRKVFEKKKKEEVKLYKSNQIKKNVTNHRYIFIN